MANVVFLLIGVFLGFIISDIIDKKHKKISYKDKQRVRNLAQTNKSTFISYKPPKSVEQEAEEKAKENIQQV